MQLNPANVNENRRRFVLGLLLGLEADDLRSFVTEDDNKKDETTGV